MEGDGQPNPSIVISPIEYIDRVVKASEKDLNGRCEKWDLKLDSLRKEWASGHTALLQAIETAEKIKQAEKIEQEDHFRRINDLQYRMDKLQLTFASSDAVDLKIKAALSRQSINIMILLGLLTVSGAIIAALLGRL